MSEVAFRDEVVETLPPDMELPAQLGSFSTLAPGVDTFQLPANLAQAFELYDEKEKDRNGNETEKVVQRIRFVFDNDAPLIVKGGPRDGEVLRARISSSPRKRGKKGSDAPSVADLAYLLRISLNDKTSVITTTRQWHDAIASHAGEYIRLMHGLRGSCNPKGVRYIDNGEGGSKEDPAGTMGCGKYYRTKDFKQDDGTYSNELDCDCGAVIRAFGDIEQYLPPLGEAPAKA